jgi:catechol-2,3-dioxygenase
MILEKLELLTANLQATKSFYQDMLELQLVEDKEYTFTVQAGATHIKFEATEAYDRPFYHFALNIPENKFREAKSWIQSRVQLIQEEGDDEVFFSSWNATLYISKILRAILLNLSLVITSLMGSLILITVVRSTA